MNTQEVKTAATDLARHLKDAKIEITHSQALEVIARMGGVKEWRALS